VEGGEGRLVECLLSGGVLSCKVGCGKGCICEDGLGESNEGEGGVRGSNTYSRGKEKGDGSDAP